MDFFMFDLEESMRIWETFTEQSDSYGCDS